MARLELGDDLEWGVILDTPVFEPIKNDLTSMVVDDVRKKCAVVYPDLDVSFLNRLFLQLPLPMKLLRIMLPLPKYTQYPKCTLFIF